MPTVKQQLHDLCHKYLDDAIADAQQAVNSAREAADNETKSSAGDKYETAREMMQQEIDMNNLRIAELQRQKAGLQFIDPGKISDAVQNGSIVRTSQGNYFLGVSIGKLVLEKVPYYTLTTSAPLGARLTNKRKGDKFNFNGREFVILEVA